MATALLSQDQFLCPICLDVFTNPVTIPCGHNFCEACIKTYWDQSERCSCPVCKKSFQGKPDLRVNTLISEMAVQLRDNVGINPNLPQEGGQDVDIPCDICLGVKQEAVRSCLVCLASYCAAHLEPHQRVSTLKRHKLIAPVQDLENCVCQTHGNMFTLFCRRDQTFCCSMCAEHTDHRLVSLEEEYREKKAKAIREGARTQEMIQERQQRAQKMKDLVQAKSTDKAEAIVKCVEVFTALESIIQTEQASLIHLIEETHTAAERQDEGRIRKLEDEIAELQMKHAQFQSLAQCDNHMRLLRNFQSVSAPPRTAGQGDATIYSALYVEAVRTAVSHLKMSLGLKMSSLVHCVNEAKRHLSRVPEEEQAQTTGVILVERDDARAEQPSFEERRARLTFEPRRTRRVLMSMSECKDISRTRVDD